jgi:hypothetical protein
MSRKTNLIALAGVIAATVVAPSIAAAAAPGVRYDSTPIPGTVTVPSVGLQASAVNEVGGEVIVRHTLPLKHAKVTLVSWACEQGSWEAGCTTTPGSSFQVPVTLKLRTASRRDAAGNIVPGRQVTKVTKTFAIKYRPSSISSTEHRYMGADGLPHNGIAQTISFDLPAKRLGVDLVWTVSFNTSTHGPAPLGHATPTDSLNVGLSPAVRVGHDRFPGSLVWDQGGLLRVDHPYTGDGYVPAAQFSTR